MLNILMFNVRYREMAKPKTSHLQNECVNELAHVSLYNQMLSV